MPLIVVLKQLNTMWMSDLILKTKLRPKCKSTMLMVLFTVSLPVAEDY